MNIIRINTWMGDGGRTRASQKRFTGRERKVASRLPRGCFPHPGLSGADHLSRKKKGAESDTLDLGTWKHRARLLLPAAQHSKCRAPHAPLPPDRSMGGYKVAYASLRLDPRPTPSPLSALVVSDYSLYTLTPTHAHSQVSACASVRRHTAFAGQRNLVYGTLLVSSARLRAGPHSTIVYPRSPVRMRPHTAARESSVA